MTLHRDFKKILKRAWSVRFLFLAGIFSTAEVVLPMFSEEIPRGIFVALTGLAITGSLVARITTQKEFGDDR